MCLASLATANDTEGKFNAIVRELKHLQNVDIKYLQKSLASTKEEFRNKLENEARTIYHATDKNISAIDKEFHMQINDINKKFPPIETRQNELTSSFTSTMNQIEEYNHSTSAKLIALSSKTDVIDARIQDLEAHSIQSNKQIQDLIEQGKKSNELVKQLSSRLGQSETAHNETKTIYSEMMRCVQQNIRNLQDSYTLKIIVP